MSFPIFTRIPPAGRVEDEYFLAQGFEHLFASPGIDAATAAYVADITAQSLRLSTARDEPADFDPRIE
jgi:hypothetical protein